MAQYGGSVADDRDKTARNHCQKGKPTRQGRFISYSII
jgi:hypothetical protein